MKGLNTCYILSGITDNLSHVVAHELGHSMGGLLHPNDYSTEDGESLMRETVDILNGKVLRTHDWYKFYNH